MLRILACAVLFGFLSLVGAANADISILTAPPALEPNRSVDAQATGHPGSDASTSAAGFWDELVEATGAPAAGAIKISARQTSTIPDTVGPAISASAESTALIEMPGGLGYTYRGDSTFDANFEVTQEQTYYFRGDVAWSGSLPEFNSGFATLVFRDDTNNTSIFFAAADELDPGSAFDIVTILSPGIVYQLKVRAHLSGESDAAGSYAASASFSFDLIPVPEPATALMAGIGLMGACLGTVRRRGSSKREMRGFDLLSTPLQS